MTNVQYLWLRGSSISDKGLLYLTKMSKLQGLDLGNNQITDEGLRILGKMTGLIHLNVSGNVGIKGSGLIHLKSLTSLMSLDLHSTQVTDDSLVHLKHLKNLIKLNIRGTNILGLGYVHLYPLRKLRDLQIGKEWLPAGASLSNMKATKLDSKSFMKKYFYHKLDLTHRLSSNSVRALKSALPKCKIYWYPGIQLDSSKPGPVLPFEIKN
ncbi:MAG: hypothetical protein Tsb009_37570 [Planctomycetaceae bacterium]